jgi:hypothetical protein
MKQNYDGTKFKLHEIFNNTSGKTSASGFCGVLLVFVASISFLAAMAGYFLKVQDTLAVMQSIILMASMGVGLLGLRKWRGTTKDISTQIGDDNTTIDASTGI